MKKSLKKIGNANPVMTQRFGADPYAMVYEDRVYLYMTGDDFIYDETGEKNILFCWIWNCFLMRFWNIRRRLKKF